MATFLQLCADLARESGAVGVAPSAVTGQTGRQAKVVEWIRDAWTLIQNENADADFLRAELDGTLVPGTTQYTPASLNITSFARWIGGYDNISIYPDGEQEQEAFLLPISYERWRQTFNFRTHEALRPVYYAVGLNTNLCIGPKPDLAYKIRGMYQRGPQELTANGDVPLAPDRFHQIIVWRAAMMLAQHDEAWDAMKGAQMRYAALLTDLQRDCLPEVTTSGNTIGR